MPRAQHREDREAREEGQLGRVDRHGAQVQQPEETGRHEDGMARDALGAAHFGAARTHRGRAGADEPGDEQRERDGHARVHHPA